MHQAIVSGVIPGSVYALLGVSLVLVYRMTGVLNFAQTAIGAFGAYTFIALAQAGIGVVPAALLGLLASAALSLFLGWLMVSFFLEEGPEIRATVTIAFCLGILALGFRVFGDNPRPMPRILPEWSLEMGRIVLSSGTIISLAFAALTAGGLALLMQKTRIGLQMRGMAARPTTAKIIGIPVTRLSYIVWILVGMIAAIAITLAAPTRSSSFLSLTLLIIPSLAAALFGLYRSFGLALFGGLLLGLLEGVATMGSFTGTLRNILPLIAISLMLGWTQRKERWDASR